jgi:adenylate kinase
MHTIIFFGRSGSGKGTQAKLLKEYLEEKDGKDSVLYFETGNALRKLAEEDSVPGRLTKGVLESGGLMPAMLVVWLWGEYFMHDVESDKHLLLDGLARRKEEAPLVHDALQFFGRKKPIIVYINTTYETSFRRLMERGRADDTEENIKRRLSWFDENVAPSIEFFRDKGDEYNFIEVNGDLPVEDIQKVLKANLG